MPQTGSVASCFVSSTAVPLTGSLPSCLGLGQQHILFLRSVLLLTHEQAQSYSWLRRQVQSRHLCSAHAPQTVVSFFATALRARCSRTEALLAEVSWDLAKASTDIPAKSTCSIAVRYSPFRSRITSPMQAQAVCLTSAS